MTFFVFCGSVVQVVVFVVVVVVVVVVFSFFDIKCPIIPQS